MSARGKKKFTKWIVSITLIAIIGLAGWLLAQWILYRNVKFTRYPEFGIGIPNAYSIHGIDVSRYQQLIAWEEVKAMKVADIQLGFAFIKATEGVGNVDLRNFTAIGKEQRIMISSAALTIFLSPVKMEKCKPKIL